VIIGGAGFFLKAKIMANTGSEKGVWGGFPEGICVFSVLIFGIFCSRIFPIFVRCGAPRDAVAKISGAFSAFPYLGNAFFRQGRGHRTAREAEKGIKNREQNMPKKKAL